MSRLIYYSCFLAEWLGAGFYLNETVKLAFAPIAVEGASWCGTGGCHVDELLLSTVTFKDPYLREWRDATAAIGALGGVEFA